MKRKQIDLLHWITSSLVQNQKKKSISRIQIWCLVLFVCLGFLFLYLVFVLFLFFLWFCFCGFVFVSVFVFSSAWCTMSPLLLASDTPLLEKKNHNLILMKHRFVVKQ